MSRFRFPLQKVLEHRQASERESAEGLARARDEAEAAHQAKENLEAARDAGRARLAQAHGLGGAVGHLQNMSYVLGQVDGQIEEADEACREADEQVVEQMKSFQHAVQQRRTIEGLREKKLDQWRSATERQEQKTMDEVALTRHQLPSQMTPRGGE